MLFCVSGTARLAGTVFFVDRDLPDFDFEVGDLDDLGLE